VTCPPRNSPVDVRGWTRKGDKIAIQGLPRENHQDIKDAVWDYGDSLTPNKGSLGVHIRRVRRLSEESTRKRVSVAHNLSQNMF